MSKQKEFPDDGTIPQEIVDALNLFGVDPAGLVVIPKNTDTTSDYNDGPIEDIVLYAKGTPDLYSEETGFVEGEKRLLIGSISTLIGDTYCKNGKKCRIIKSNGIPYEKCYRSSSC